jgi:lipopolysaccharide/colanic/teichoic acid biosynthesis glycosyltransferase
MTVLFASARQSAARPLPAWKRPLDLTLTLLGLLAIWPVLLAVALAVRLSGPGPVFFVQTRIGRDGQPFGMIKFRSMHVDAEARRAALLAQSDRQGICFKSRRDPRITPVGRILRRLSLDELPQIFNVLRGEMSLVGPRPALPEEVRAYPPRALGRLAVLPGITGLWQVSGRAEVGFDDMVEMDLAYAADGRLSTDLGLLARTLGAVFSGRGAY